MSKYIGETEKNLRRVFDAAEEAARSCSSTKPTRSSASGARCKDSHDRYANIEISYLLQRMEAYRGLAILTTNMRSALDPAFLRRLRFVVSSRSLMPRSVRRSGAACSPRETPTVGFRPDKLARLSVSGGHIRNIAMTPRSLPRMPAAPCA